MAYEYREISKEGSFDQGIRRYTRTYQVIVDSPNYGPGQICSLTPDALYQSWVSGTEVDAWALLKKKSAKMVQDNSGLFWEVVCEYDSQPFQQNQGGLDPGSGTGGSSGSTPSEIADTQPDLRPWTVEFGTVRTTKLVTMDLTATDVVSSNGQPFDPGLEIPVCHPTITITRFKAAADESLANVANYAGSINDGIWQGLPAFTVICTEYKLSSLFEQGQWWWQKVVSFEIFDEPLNPVKILDCGTFERNASTPTRAIYDNSGTQLTSPVPLDGNGLKLPLAAPFHYNEFTAYREVDWTDII